MSKDIIQLNDKAIGIDVPKEAKKFLISHAQSDNDLLWINEWGHPNYLKTLPGELMSWTILGLAKDLTEDQWKEVVEGDTFFDIDDADLVGQDYEGDPCWKCYDESANYCWTAKESGLSLLQSKGLSPDTSLVIIKKDK